MPELPEVEIVKRSLNELVSNQTIIGAELIRQKLAPGISRKRFAESVRNMKINSVDRRGKHLLFDLSGELTLIVHLRMTGKFILVDVEADNPKFAHAVFYLENSQKLIFEDQRHFGFMNIVESGRLAEAKELKKLAPEPFSDEFSSDYLRNVLRSSKRPVKELLLDQTKICGLGNIYAAEALFLARINPRIRADRISAVKANRLRKRILEVLKEAIDYSSELPIDAQNLTGRYFGSGIGDSWRVYGRENERCFVCNTKIKRIRQAGRSSFFCSRCQNK